MARPSLGWTVGGIVVVTSVPPGAHECGRPLEDVTADRVEHHVDLGDVFQLIGLQVQEGIYAEAEAKLAVGDAAGTDHSGSHLARQLRGDRTDTPATP